MQETNTGSPEGRSLAETPLPPRQPYYVPVVPQEPENPHPGRAEGMVALVFAALSAAFFPPIFGIAGIILGLQSRRKGRKALGTAAIVLSIVCMAAGIALGAYQNLNRRS